jgi:hypothetical protein
VGKESQLTQTFDYKISRDCQTDLDFEDIELIDSQLNEKSAEILSLKKQLNEYKQYVPIMEKQLSESRGLVQILQA